jgi:hypothetical protein
VKEIMFSKNENLKRNTPVLEYSQTKDKITMGFPIRFEYSETKAKYNVTKFDRDEVSRYSLSHSSQNTASEGRNSFKPNSVRLEKKTITNCEESETYESKPLGDIDNEELEVIISSNFALSHL